MPWWNCNSSIKWLMKRLSGKKSNNSGYLFFANSDLVKTRSQEEQLFTLNFVTLDTLLSKTELMKTRDDNKSALYNISGAGPECYDENNVLAITMNLPDKQALKGITGGHYYGWDNTKKQPIDVSFTYADQIKKHTILGYTSLFADISDVSLSRYFTGEQNEAFINNLAYDDWVKRYLLQMYITITVPGNENRYAGGLINIVFPIVTGKQIGRAHV